jgi:hypothetical protein
MCGDYEVSLLPCSLREMEFLCETNCPSLVAEFGGRCQGGHRETQREFYL